MTDMDREAVLPGPHAVAFEPNAVLITNPAAFPEGARPLPKGAISGVFQDSNAHRATVLKAGAAPGAQPIKSNFCGGFGRDQRFANPEGASI
jgi:hypothetical protein